MADISLTFFLVGIPAVILAGVSKGGFGSRASFVAAPLMALVLPPEQALGVLTPLLLLIDGVTLRPYWNQWDAKKVRLLLLGAVPGLVLGVFFWKLANADMLRFLIGSIALSYVVLRGARLFLPPRDVRRPALRWVGALSGGGAAFTSFVSHAGGPVLAVYLLSQGLTKTSYQATTVLVFAVINVAKTVAYVFLGAIKTQTLMSGLYLVPAALFGAWLGVVAHRAVPARAFFVITHALLLAAGSKLIFDAPT